VLEISEEAPPNSNPTEISSAQRVVRRRLDQRERLSKAN
jgi:hypothetical protein